MKANVTNIHANIRTTLRDCAQPFARKTEPTVLSDEKVFGVHAFVYDSRAVLVMKSTVVVLDTLIDQNDVRVNGSGRRSAAARLTTVS